LGYLAVSSLRQTVCFNLNTLKLQQYCSHPSGLKL
jgi:hypothetical protein